MKPLIGISGNISIETAPPFSGYQRSYVNHDYVRSVIASGGIPVIIPISNDDEVIKAQIAACDGLILSGGQDVDPVHYQKEPLEKLGITNPERDRFDFKLLDYAQAKQLPILAICRGIQVLNVYHGGSLYQDVSYYESDLSIKHSQDSAPGQRTHGITVTPDSKLHALLGKETLRVNSFHHQLIKKVGKQLKVSAVALDGAIEAVEHIDYPWQIGVQWHPEMLIDDPQEMKNLFDAFISKAQKKQSDS